MESSRFTVPERDVTLADGRVLRQDQSKSAHEVMLALLRRGVLEVGTWYDARGMRVIATLEAYPERVMLHVSVSYAQHNPSWKELHLLKRAFFGDEVSAMQVLPKESTYVNAHPHTFHLWEMPVDWETL